ncbi:MAG: hypothetical protein ACYC55_07830 [Candidatus Geothermincolia bacterium]
MREAAAGMQDPDDWNFDVIKISAIDPTWAVGGASHKTQPENYQGEAFWLHKVDDTWFVVDIGTGLTAEDVGAPSDLNP